MSDDIVNRLHRHAMAQGAQPSGSGMFDLLWDAKLEIEQLRLKLAEIEKTKTELGWQIDYDRGMRG